MCWRLVCGLDFAIVNWPSFADFLIAVEAEMNKVSWPSRTELIRASMVVIVLMFGLAPCCYTYDLVLNWILVDVLERDHYLTVRRHLMLAGIDAPRGWRNEGDLIVAGEPESIASQTPRRRESSRRAAETVPRRTCRALRRRLSTRPRRGVRHGIGRTDAGERPRACLEPPPTKPTTVASQVEEEPADAPFAAPLELIDESVADEDMKFDWFILKVQVNREDSIKDALGGGSR